MVNVGILGLGPDWETRHRPALETLRGRIHVRSVYDPVFNLAEQAANGCRASAAPGIQALLEQPDVRAILLLDTAWYGHHLLEMLCESDKPAYIAGGLGVDITRLRRFHERASSRGLTLMPEFSRRYTPATSRLQELIATELGPPHHLVIEAPASPVETPSVPDAVTQQPGCLRSELLVELFDWCRYILRTPPVSLRADLPESDDDGGVSSPSMTVEFRRPRTGSDPPRAELHLVSRSAERPEESGPPPGRTVSYDIHCERGSASIQSPADISWSTGSEVRTESLQTERSETEVMLDHFCRRVVGGLIPVADLGDVCRSLHLALAAEESHRTGRKVMLNGQT